MNSHKTHLDAWKLLEDCELITGVAFAVNRIKEYRASRGINNGTQQKGVIGAWQLHVTGNMDREYSGVWR